MKLFFCEKIIQITLHLLAISCLFTSSFSLYKFYFFVYNDFQVFVVGGCAKRNYYWCSLFVIEKNCLRCWIPIEWVWAVLFSLHLFERKYEEDEKSFFSSTSTILNFDKMSLLSSPFFKLFFRSLSSILALCSFASPFTLVCEREKLPLLLRLCIYT